MSKPTHRRMITSGLAVLLAVQTIGTAPAAMAAVSPAPVKAEAASGAVKSLQPIWSVPTDSSVKTGDYGDEGRTVIEPFKGMAITLKEGQMIALHAKTGERMWKFGAKLLPYFTMGHDSVYAITQGGSLVSVTLQGKLRWSVPTGTFALGDKVVLLENMLYVLRSRSMQAFDTRTGKLLWKSVVPNGTSTPVNLTSWNDTLIGTRWGQGAITTLQLFALDKRTGKKLWTLNGQNLPISYWDGSGLFTQTQDITMGAAERKLTFRVVDLLTGKILKTREYRHTPVNMEGFHFLPRAVLEGNTLYIFWGDEIAAYDMLDESENPKPLRTFAQPKDEYPTGMIKYDQFIMKNDRLGRNSAIRTASGEHIQWDEQRAPRYEADIIGRGLYEKYENGQLKAYDLRNGQLVFTAATGSGKIGKVLRTGPYLVVEKDGRVLGYKIPEQLH
ncbi:outer membrane protein assembly factor BamB family protein [Paenibacillus mendelii]|uniref:PQQ-binding-like beta-propeller repeat protein n=1 Tax=Paenibacillus mendelii TaxID=206163 RepID=A0ABV6J2T9_9BACL|nr:PQQ-binding-like beta-propeller repeat protein [Paenibacillus mendelii]MCQ6559305.1 PQQ-binding-like beta-propeller repeat protein [Paenibacillus mendelii]